MWYLVEIIHDLMGNVAKTTLKIKGNTEEEIIYKIEDLFGDSLIGYDIIKEIK